MPERSRQVVIVNYGLGNLFSVRRACEQVGLCASITSLKTEVVAAAAIILPGVGAFGVARENLDRLDLIEPLRDAASSGLPILGICLGMQLLMSESHEFGRHPGLGLLEGQVVRLDEKQGSGRPVKVPHVGWNRIWSSDRPLRWENTLLDGLDNGEYMYFVHSFHCVPGEKDAILSTTSYGDAAFCSAVGRRNIVGVQFHPERSGRKGLEIYRNLSRLITSAGKEANCEHGA